MLGVIRHDTQVVYVNSQYIQGAIGHAVNVSVSREPVSIAGYQPTVIPNPEGILETSPNAIPEIDFSVNRNIVTQNDPITGFFTNYVTAVYRYGVRDKWGEIGSIDSLKQGDQKFFSLENGVLTNYNISCTVGGIATSNFSIKGLGNAGTDNNYDSSSDGTPSLDITIAKDRDLVLNVAGYSTNRIQSIDYNLTVGYNTKYYVGGGGTFSNEINYPIELRCAFELEVDDYEVGDIWEMLCSPTNQNLTFLFNDCADGGIRRFSLPDGELIDYSHNASTEGPMTATFTYASYLNDVTKVAAILSSIYPT